MVNVVVARKRTIQVSSNATSGILDTTLPVTIKNTPTFGSLSASQRLDHLQDVNASGETDGAVPVYDSTIDKYVIQKLNISNVIGDLDGGNF